MVHRLAAQQISTVGIAQSERIDALAIARAKPALEIHAPGLIGTCDAPKGLSVGWSLASLRWRYTQPFALQQFPHRAQRRPSHVRLFPLQISLHLLPPPPRTPPPHLSNLFFLLPL